MPGLSVIVEFYYQIYLFSVMVVFCIGHAILFSYYDEFENLYLPGSDFTTVLLCLNWFDIVIHIPIVES